jgi:predicted amidohydrolase YtcJ
MRKLFTAAILFVTITSCSQKEKADLLVFNATIYTVDSAFSTAEAMVVSAGKIIATGKKDELEKSYDTKEKLDAGGKFIYPGFIDAHAHFMGYAESLTRANLVGTTSWDDVLEKLKSICSRE